MLAVIMAGGKGSRISSIASDIPKPMIPVCGKSVLEYQIETLKKQGHTHILIVTGHLGHKISEYFADGSAFGVHIEYWTETEPLGTAGALFKCMDMLEDDFLLLCGDILFDIDIERFIRFHYEKKAFVSLAAHPNNHPYDSAVLEVDKTAKLTGWLNKEDSRGYYRNIVNAGIHIISKDFISRLSPAKEKVDLDRDILKPAISTGRIYVYNTPEYIKDMGTPGRFFEAEQDIKNGLAALRNLSRKQRAVFLDRDGTLNELCDRSGAEATGFVTSPDSLKLIAGAAEAVHIINNAGYLAIVITNQPVIARGLCGFDTMDMIHKKLETELGKEGAYINDIYYCPHHPHSGFEGELTELKIDCECRKPKPGMLLEAAEKYNIDLSKSWMIGDSFRDVDAGKNAGCKTAYIDYDGKETGADITVKTLREAVEKIFSV